MRILAATVGVTLLQQVALATNLTLEGSYWGDPAAWSGGQLPTTITQDVNATSTCGGSCESLFVSTPQGAPIQAVAGNVNADGRSVYIGPGASLRVQSLQSTSLTMTGGRLTNTLGGIVSPGTTIIRSNGALGATQFTGAGTFQLGNVTFVDGALELRGTGRLVNPETGLMSIRNNQTDFDRTGSFDLYFEFGFTNAGVVDFQGPSQVGNFPSPNSRGTEFLNTASGTIRASDPLASGLPTRIFPFVDNLGRIEVSSGTLTLVNGGTHTGSSAVLEASGNGVLELWSAHQIDDGVVNVTGSGTVVVGGSPFSASSLSVGGTATLAISVAGFFQSAPMTVQSGGSVLNTGNFYAFDALAVDGGGTLRNDSFMQLAGTIENAGTVILDGFSLILGDGDYTQTGGSTHIGPSAVMNLTLPLPDEVREGTFQQQGGTTIVDGLLRAGSVEFLAGTVGGSGIIEYTGSLTSAVIFGAGLTVQGGNSPGILTINGNLEAAGAIFDIEVGGLEPGTLFDQLVVNGDANLTDATVNFRFLDGFLPTPGDTFNWLAVSGFTSGLDTLTVSFFSDAGTIGGFLLGDGSLYVDSVTPVPLPPAAWALGSAVLALGVVRRRGRRARQPDRTGTGNR
jgi:hypothetical protein